jgi:bifunctional non-homologous end joining protein LigD
MGKLKAYRAKRDFEQTPEPAPAPTRTKTRQPRFVVHEHHATRLHWDLRLERDGVLVSWAVPKGIPPDPKRNHLAVHVEDHPLDYIDFKGTIPRGNYGAGEVLIFDSGTYESHKWQMDDRKGEVMITLHGKRLKGRYVLFRTRGNDWMIHRMDLPQDPDREPMPDWIQPMLAKLSPTVPAPEDAFGFEFKWDGIRAVAFSETGTWRLMTRNREDVTRRYPELRALSDRLGAHAAILDSEVVALGPNGVPSFEQLQQRIGLNSESEIRRMMKEVPVIMMIFDLLYLDGRSLLGTPYVERRSALEDLKLSSPHWQTPEYRVGDGTAMFEASKRSGLEGILAKRLTSLYEPGRRSGAWMKAKNRLEQEFVVGGWLDGQGRRQGSVGSLLVGYWEDGKLVYAGRVGSGFSDRTLDELDRLLAPLAREQSPFGKGSLPRGAQFVEPKLVVEVEFAEWTAAGQLRAPVYKGLRPGKDPSEVVREQ